MLSPNTVKLASLNQITNTPEFIFFEYYACYKLFLMAVQGILIIFRINVLHIKRRIEINIKSTLFGEETIEIEFGQK